MWWWAIRLLRMDRQVETTTSAEKVQRGRCYWARLLFSRSQPPRRAASRCCASRDTTCRGSATMRGKCCVDSHAFRDEGKETAAPRHANVFALECEDCPEVHMAAGHASFQASD